jgi:ABC-type microcin C transport system permease subunit YejB
MIVIVVFNKSSIKKLFCLRTKTDSPNSETFTYRRHTNQVLWHGLLDVHHVLVHHVALVNKLGLT